jgi:hypothetical protein
MREAIRRLLLLDVEQNAARAYGPDRLERIRTLAAAGRRCTHAAHLLVDEDVVAPAAELDREAILLLLAALLVAKGLDVDERDPSRLLELVKAGPLGEIPELAAVAPLLEPSPDHLRFDRLSGDEAIFARGALGRVAAYLSRQVHVRLPREIRAARRRRIAVVALALCALLALGIAKAAQPRNLALNRPVSTGPVMVVDLGAPQPIGRIVVYGRDDFSQSRLPLVAEVSTDGAGFTEVGRQPEPVGHARAWTVRFGRSTARFVRVRVDGPAPDVLSVGELEVYAR